MERRSFRIPIRKNLWWEAKKRNWNLWWEAKRGSKTCDEKQKRGTEDQFACWTHEGSNTELWRVTGYFEQANHPTQSDQASSENKARCTIETKESTNRDYGRRANTPNSLNQREIFKFALMGTKPYNFRNSKHDLDLPLMQPVGLFKFTCFYSSHGTERDTSFTRDRSVFLLF